MRCLLFLAINPGWDKLSMGFCIVKLWFLDLPELCTQFIQEVINKIIEKSSIQIDLPSCLWADLGWFHASVYMLRFHAWLRSVLFFWAANVICLFNVSHHSLPIAVWEAISLTALYTEMLHWILSIFTSITPRSLIKLRRKDSWECEVCVCIFTCKNIL